IHCSFLIHHNTGTSKRNPFQAVTSIISYPFKNIWSHTDGKLDYTNSILLGKQKMTKFMNKYCNSNNQNKRNNTNPTHAIHLLSINSYVARSVCKISSTDGCSITGIAFILDSIISAICK